MKFLDTQQRVSFKCNKCGKILPVVYYGTMDECLKEIDINKLSHNCKKFKKYTLIEEIK